MPLAVVFPGQGSQLPAAGRPWVDRPEWSVVTRAEAAVGRPLSPLLLDPEADLSRTRDAQLAVLLTSLLVWEASAPLIGSPVAFAGHSLGQITALVASGSLPLEDGLRLAAARADATQRAADSTPGRMVALLGATEDQAAEACLAAPGEAWVANVNGPGQVVIGGTPDGTEAAAARASELGVRRTRVIPVGGAFHTPMMHPAVEELRPLLDRLPFASATAPVVANHDARPYDDPGGWPDRLARQLVEPVRWSASVDTVVALGADQVVEVGSGTTLTGLLRRQHRDLDGRNIAAPEDVDQLRPAAVPGARS